MSKILDAGAEPKRVPFGVLPGTGFLLERFDPPHPLTPKELPFVFDPDQVRDAAIAIRENINVMLTGPKGCGKTSLIMQLAARLGRPCIRFNCHGETRVGNLVGQQRPAAKDGVLTLLFCPGDLAVAMREGWWVFLDEIDAALPSVLFVLQPVLEEAHRTLHIPETGETIHAHPDFRIFAAGNTIGYRASSRARHAGTNAMNSAFVDRFGMIIACGYPSEAAEIARILINVPTLHKLIAECIGRTVSKLREDENFRTDFSTRSSVQWARLIDAYAKATAPKETEQAEQIGKRQGAFVMMAAEASVLRKIENATDGKIAIEMIQRVFGLPPTKAML